MRLLVTGSRHWGTPAEKLMQRIVLDGCLIRANQRAESFHLIEGGAKGADKIASEWIAERIAQKDGVGHNGAWGDTMPFFTQTEMDHEVFMADWSRIDGSEGYDPAAGPARNARMIETGQPTVCIAFKSDFDHTLTKGGTEDCVKRAKAAGIPTFVVSAV